MRERMNSSLMDASPRSFNATSTSNSTSSSSSSSRSTPGFVRDMQAAFKRHRPVGIVPVMHRPVRNVVPQRETPKESKSEDAITAMPQREEASLGPGHGNALQEIQRKVHFSSNAIATSCGADDQMATGTGDLLSHMDSLALTEKMLVMDNQVDTSAAANQDWRNHNLQGMEMENSLRSEGGITSVLTGRTMGVHDQLHQFGNFLQNDLNNAMTQSSVVGSSCVTSTLMNSSSAPMINSTTYCSQSQAGGARLGTGPAEEAEGQINAVQPSCSLSKNTGGTGESAPQSAVASQAISSALATATEVNKSSDPYLPPSDMKMENSKSEKLESGATGKATSTSRKKGYDPDLFFKVNGKLYQRLGKIGSGGSSEVHKVISSDCTIYALKKIKLKGRDYATAFGFCQEIEYLDKLRGKNNIIQLVDYEVTDKTLLREVMQGSMSNKERRVKDDGFIYMVLEHGEIDLAHMLAQKWKELDGSNATIDENWLRFYWQQILQAVNTIHEERIVHSDLKPANFLLVRGSLKLIDFGIAKAIMSDTTNIQRDSQVGTLSYMSPEAFMCNETDANGNTIKCGRSSDIWSLGCILYQMVYGRTPFAEYRTFWAKFKVITDPNHKIIYEPLPNPWLLDLMKKCLAWDRNERWRIPQLLQHPFLVPPVPPKSPSPPDQLCTLLQLIAESTVDDQKGELLCSQLQGMLTDPRTSVSRDQLRKFLFTLNRLV
ncbi:hypothetical protein SASPL_150159 [Salvia splendens]|uniref:Protein kinase domain-containing protein n=1 Tax=Salvia splendens TaxID=180675 RepID=A0A8X8Z2L3_SALSN|nr:hypothetical protein SASPL_150159 [Salvia splendens]